MSELREGTSGRTAAELASLDTGERSRRAAAEADYWTAVDNVRAGYTPGTGGARIVYSDPANAGKFGPPPVPDHWRDPDPHRLAG